MARIAIATEDDAIWALSGWERALPRLREAGHEVVGIWAVEARLGRYTGFKIPLWYYRRLGPFSFFKLALFALRHGMTRRRLRRPASLAALAEAHGIAFRETDSPNDAAFVEWLKHEQVDVLLISVGHILKNPVLAAPRLGIINKHAGLLPANKGLWPYLWAVVEGMPQGISYHLVNDKVDAGPLLIQDTMIPEEALGSMIAFYAYVYGRFGQQMAEAVELLLKRHFLPQGYGQDARPRSLPDRRAFRAFRRKGGRVVRMEDVWLAQALVEEEL